MRSDVNESCVESNDVRDAFQDVGFVILRQLLPSSVVKDVRRELGEWVDRFALTLLEEGASDSLFAHESFEMRLIRILQNCPERTPRELRRELHLAGMFSLFVNPGLLDVVEGILGPEIRLYPNYTVRPKLPESSITEVPWHQDAAFTAAGHHGRDPNAGELSADRLRTVNVWTPLVPANRQNGCMQFIPGSHKLGIVPHVLRHFDYLEISDDVLKPCLAQAIDVAVDPGDVVLFSNLLFHVGLPNRSDAIRWSCDWRYQDARQSTMRSERGHMARSHGEPASVVRDASHWASLSFN
jgi:phytanoyl-CoA hydroxylase